MPSDSEEICIQPSGTGVYENVVYTKESSDRAKRYADGNKKTIGRYSAAVQNLIPVRTTEKNKNNGGSRIDDAGLFSFVTYSWVFPYLYQAVRGKLNRDQVWGCSFYDSCGLNMARLEVLWEEERKVNPKDPSLFKVIYRFIKTRLWFSCAVFFFCLIFGFIGPTCFIRRLIAFAENPERDEESNIVYSYGIALVAAISIVEFARVLSYGATWAVSYRTGIRVRGAVLALLYKHVLNAKDLCGKTEPDVINIFANDGQRLFDAVTFAPLVLVGPLVLLGGIGYLVLVIGRWSLLGIFVFFIFDVIQFCLGKSMVACRNLAIIKTEKRISLMGEIIKYIRIIKINGWEDVFSKKVNEFRQEEKVQIRKSGYAQSLAIACGPVVPVVAAILTFLGVVLAGNDLLASDAFSAITVYFVMLFGIRMIPYGSRYLAEAVVALRRIKEFLLLEAYETYPVTNADDVVLHCAEGSYTYQPKKATPEPAATTTEADALVVDQSVFSSIFNNFTIKKGEHIAVIGSVGSGKSAILKAISGHMFTEDDSISVDRTQTVYVPQKPWIFNGTVQDNILFGDKMNAEKYYKSVHGCQLTEDLTALSHGDNTEVGERGATLSGGQKARISLARAVFQTKDLFLLDDVFASLDKKVANKIHNEIIQKLLKKKALIMVTNNMELLPSFDRVLYVEGGRIVADGFHDDLYENNDNYKNFVNACQTYQPSSGTISPIGEAPPPVPSLESEQLKSSSENVNAGSDAEKLITDEEDMGNSTISWNIYMQYVHAAGSWPIWVCLIVGFIINVVSNIFSTYWLSRWLKKGHDETVSVVNGSSFLITNESLADSPLTGFYSTVYLVSLVVLTISGLLKACVFVKVSLTAATRLHDQMFNSLIRGATSFFDSTPTGRILNRFSKDMDEIDVKLPFTAEVFLQNMITCLGFLVVIVSVFPYFLFFAIPLFVVFIVFVSCFRAGIRNLKRSEHISRSPLYDHVTASLEGMTTIHSLQQSNRFLDILKKHLDSNSGAIFMFQSAMRWLAVWLDLLVVVMTGVVALLTVMLTGTVSPADAGMAIAFAVQMSGIFQFAVRTQTELEAKMTSVERVSYYAKNIQSDGEWNTRRGVDVPSSWPANGQINFSGVKLRYRPNLPLALNDISFEIKAGEKVGIIGRTGSGKSSLGNLICRLYPVTNGQIFIDGVDIATVGLTKLRRAVSAIAQDPSLFSGTIRFNLDPTNEFSDSQIWQALEKCYLKDLVSTLDQKLNAEVSHGGDNFSVGERQLFCLARALLSNSRIVILDEATASVDAATDKLIQNVIKEVFVDATVLIIAHRLDNVRNMDRVMLLKHAKLVNFTTPQEMFKDDWSVYKLEDKDDDQNSAVVVGENSEHSLEKSSQGSSEESDDIVKIENEQKEGSDDVVHIGRDDVEEDTSEAKDSSDTDMEVVQ